MEIVKEGRIWDNRTFLVDLPSEVRELLEKGHTKPRTSITVRKGVVEIKAIIEVA